MQTRSLWRWLTSSLVRRDSVHAARASEDQELMAQEEILRDETLSSTGFQGGGQCAQQMRTQHEEVVHGRAD